MLSFSRPDVDRHCLWDRWRGLVQRVKRTAAECVTEIEMEATVPYFEECVCS